jgi:serine phosphatase RsbU (regulator of sigma subunit)/Flp pilus assembly protein TadD
VLKHRSLFFLLFICLCCSAPASTVDSLKNALTSAKEDTVKVKVLNSLAWEFQSSNTPQSLQYAQQALALAKQLNYKSGLISAYNSIGIAYYFTGAYPEALRNYFEAIKLLEESGNKKRLGGAYNNIAALYLEQEQYPDAEKYFTKSLEIDKALDDKEGMAQSYNNLGTIYHDQGRDDEALAYYFRALHLREETGDKEGMPSTYSNIGNSLMNKKEFAKAAEYMTKALNCYKENGDTMGISLAYVNIADLLTEKKDFAKAVVYYDSCITIAKKYNYRDYLSYAYRSMADADARMGRFEDAYTYHQLYMNVKDSMYNKENAQQISEMQTRYETEKKEQEISGLMKDKKIREEEISRQSLLTRGIALVVVLLLIVTLLLVRGYYRKKKGNTLLALKNEKIELAYNIIEDQHKDIMDSINYAKRIQQAILPPDAVIKKYLPDSFILYLPKDVVSGDFYWLEPWGNNILFAAVDCTGHGVPGALMSVVGYNLLGKAVNELGLSKPSLILNSLSKEIGKTLQQTGSDSEVKDGMDLALCSLNMQTRMLEYAGAFNPLYIVRKGELNDVQADKIPIGSYLDGELKSYTNKEIQLEKGDMIYIFTDGYADQFGGEKGKKFKYKALQSLLVSIAEKPATEQKVILENTITAWRGNLEQVDDICIIGIRI